MPPLAWYDVLATLRDAPEQTLKQVEIAEQVLLSNSGLSRLLDRIRGAGPGRARPAARPTGAASTSELTAAGAEMLERMWPVYARGLAEDFLPALRLEARARIVSCDGDRSESPARSLAKPRRPKATPSRCRS